MIQNNNFFLLLATIAVSLTWCFQPAMFFEQQDLLLFGSNENSVAFDHQVLLSKSDKKLLRLEATTILDA